MAFNMGSYYGVSRETVATINALALRVHNNIDSTIPADVFYGLYTVNRWTATAIDKVAAAVATKDSGSAKIFGTADGLTPGHFHNLNREKVQALRALEARVTALGY